MKNRCLTKPWSLIIPNSFYHELVPAKFVRRLHRFGAEVELDGKPELVHIPNSGRLKELLYPGNEVGLHFEGHPKRKTRYTLITALTSRGWCYIDSRLPNRILFKHWSVLPPLTGYAKASPEVTAGASRFDLGLWDKEAPLPGAYVEAKCVTLVEEKTGLFPDAPTARGRKHLQELTELARKGKQGFVFFFLQHPGGKTLRANRETDPEFAELMAQAHLQGVKFHAYRVAPAGETVTLFKTPVSF